MAPSRLVSILFTSHPSSSCPNLINATIVYAWRAVHKVGQRGAVSIYLRLRIPICGLNNTYLLTYLLRRSWSSECSALIAPSTNSHFVEVGRHCSCRAQISVFFESTHIILHRFHILRLSSGRVTLTERF